LIKLYAITDHPGPALPEGAPLKMVRANGLAAVCAPAGSDELSPDALWRHEEVVEALMENRDLLPVRYGTRVESEGAATRVLAQRHDELSAALDRVRGAVELSLRIGRGSDLGTAPREPTTGREYMRARACSAFAREAAFRTVHEPLSVLARESRELPARADDELLRMAYLVDRRVVASFTSLVERLDDANPALRLLCTGPWPPYSFAER
jgi:Gas vesicle synthesis protein GvpL/GvpF